MQTLPKNFFLLIAIILGVILLYTFSSGNQRGKEILFSEFLDIVESGQITNVVIKGNKVSGRTGNNQMVITTVPKYCSVFTGSTKTGKRIEFSAVSPAVMR